MKEYFGKNAKNFRQSPDKFSKLFPAIVSTFQKFVAENKSVLDIGCGDGFLYSLIKELNAKYTGIDISKDMIDRAKEINPEGEFEVISATSLPSKFENSFDFVIANMLFPSINLKEDFVEIFVQASKALKESGYFITTIMNPFFDGYMQKYLFNREDITTNFKGYYTSPEKYVAHRVIEGVKFDYEDYHWQLSDYFTASKQANLNLIDINECKPTIDVTDIGGPSMEKMQSFPTYYILIFQK